MSRVLVEGNASNINFVFDKKYEQHIRLFEQLIDKLDELIENKENIDKFLIIDNEEIGGCTIHILTKTCALFNCGTMFNYEFDNGNFIVEKLADKFIESQVGYTAKEQYSGVFIPINKKISFTRIFGQHRFTDEECEKLLNGETITYVAKSANGNEVTFVGKLERQEYNGFEFYGFKNNMLIPSQFSKHKFTKEEIDKLSKGETIIIDAIVKNNERKIQINYNKNDGIKVLDWDVKSN